MNSFDRQGVLAEVTSKLKQIRARTWLIAVAAVFFIIGLLIWAGIAVLSWLWAQAPAATDAGKRFAGDAMTQVEQLSPGLREQAEQWLPAGVKEQANNWLQALGPDLPASDVSGSDAGPVSRFPGLVRNHFVRDGQSLEVGYAGSAAFAAVLTHYLQGFADANYAHEVVSATSQGEQHRFSRGGEFIELSLLRQRGEQLEVILKLSSQ